MIKITNFSSRVCPFRLFDKIHFFPFRFHIFTWLLETHGITNAYTVTAIVALKPFIPRSFDFLAILYYYIISRFYIICFPRLRFDYNRLLAHDLNLRLNFSSVRPLFFPPAHLPQNPIFILNYFSPIFIRNLIFYVFFLQLWVFHLLIFVNICTHINYYLIIKLNYISYSFKVKRKKKKCVRKTVILYKQWLIISTHRCTYFILHPTTRFLPRTKNYELPVVGYYVEMTIINPVGVVANLVSYYVIYRQKSGDDNLKINFQNRRLQRIFKKSKQMETAYCNIYRVVITV